MGKPFKFYDEEYNEDKLNSLSIRELKSLQKDAKYADEDLDLWIKSRIQNLPVGSGLHPDIVGKMGYRAAILRFEREIERAIDNQEMDIRDAFYEVCKRDFSKSEFDDIYTDAVMYANQRENENEDRKD